MVVGDRREGGGEGKEALIANTTERKSSTSERKLLQEERLYSIFYYNMINIRVLCSKLIIP